MSDYDEERLAALAKVMSELLQKFPQEEQDRIKDFSELRTRLIHESDRGCALVAAAYLDEAFTSLLRARLVENRQNTDALLNQGRALSSFSTKIRVSYAIGLIPKEVFHDANIVRDIRNKFAHLHGPLSFDDVGIADQCGALKLTLPSKAMLKGRMRFIHVMNILYTAVSNEARKPRATAPTTEAIMDILLASDRALDLARSSTTGEEGST